jgi:hypothetical protein
MRESSKNRSPKRKAIAETNRPAGIKRKAANEKLKGTV